MCNKLPKAFALCIAILVVTPVAAWSQDHARSAQIEQLRALVQSFGARPTKVALLTRQLIVTRGKIVRSRETSFDLKQTDGVTTILYENVLELASQKGSLSLIPDKAVKNHGRWEDVGRIYPGTKILLVYADGKSARGFSNSVSQTHLIMIDKDGRQRVDVSREQIAAVFGLIGGYGGVKAGASKGAEGMTNDRDVLLDGIFAGVGALVGMVKSDGRPILVYSK